MTPTTDTSTANISRNQIRSHQIKSLKSSAQCLLTILTAFSKEADVTTEASYAIARNIIRSIRAYTYGETTQENILQAASILDLSNQTLQRLTSLMALSE